MNGTDISGLFSDAVRIESMLGSGGSGAVYKAWHSRLQKYVVIKKTRRFDMCGAETGRNEIDALKNIRSAFVPQVLDFFTDGDSSYTVMEFVDGESFDKLLERGQQFTESQVIKWYGQLASALEAIHRQNVCHRDIKPANIMLRPCGGVCLIDFNAALVDSNEMRFVSRSPGYASPEQYEMFRRYETTSKTHDNHIPGITPYSGANVKTETDASAPGVPVLHSIRGPSATSYENSVETELIVLDCMTEVSDCARLPSPQAVVFKSVDWKRSDIYSLGATMYHLLTGVRPSQQAEEVIPVSRLGRFSENLTSIIRRSMRFEPQERFVSAGRLADAIRGIHGYDAQRRKARAKKTAAITTVVLVAALILLAKNQPHPR